MSLGLHSEGFKTHGFDASELAVAMANENGLAGLVPFWFSGRRRSLAKGMAWAFFIVQFFFFFYGGAGVFLLLRFTIIIFEIVLHIVW